MKTLAHTALFASAVLAASLPTTAQSANDAPRRTIIAVDTSGSSTFIVDQPAADAGGLYVERYIAKLDQPHDLRMISVGEVGRGKRTIDISATVTNRRASNPKRLAVEFGGYFRSLPAMNIREGATTSLVEFFTSLEGVCAKAPTMVIVFTDGVEWSSAVDGRAFVNGSIGLPKPTRPFLAGCRIEMNGIGELRSSANSDGLEQRLVPQWKAFLEAAGADSVAVTGGFFDF
jgi:hypothetical protein